MKKVLMVVSLLSLALVLYSCASTGGTKKDSTVILKNKDVSFKTEKGSLSVNNETANDLVIFVGRVEKETVLGGVSKNSTRTFDL
nr:hypothetical protein [Treponema sp.]